MIKSPVHDFVLCPTSMYEVFGNPLNLPPVASYHIITEDGDILGTEDSQELIQEG